MLTGNSHDNSKDRILEMVGPWQTPGHLMIIGGADRLDSEARLARLFLGMTVRSEENSDLHGIVLVSTATRHPEVLTGEYVRIFARLGIPESQIHAPLIRNREEACHPQNIELLSNAAGIFITGGDQYLLTQTIDRTPTEEAIMAAYGKGAVVAGTSAGATAMGRPMIVAGGGSGELKLGMVQMSHGLAWAGDDIIIDTHFGARGRFPRLTSAVAEHPQALGVGLDENTCLLVNYDGHCVVAGTGVCYFVDASHLALNSAHGAHPGAPVSLGPLRINVLAAEGEYDLRTRQVRIALEHAHKV